MIPLYALSLSPQSARIALVVETAGQAACALLSAQRMQKKQESMRKQRTSRGIRAQRTCETRSCNSNRNLCPSSNPQYTMRSALAACAQAHRDRIHCQPPHWCQSRMSDSHQLHRLQEAKFISVCISHGTLSHVIALALCIGFAAGINLSSSANAGGAFY